MSFHLTDDGTLDTVVTCDHCDAQERYTYAGQDNGGDGCQHTPSSDDCAACYTEWIEWVLEDAAEVHDCVGREWDAFADVR